MTKLVKLFLVFLFVVVDSSLDAQAMKFIRYQSQQYTASDTFPANAVADDFGPRRLSDNWHQGVDFNISAGIGLGQHGDLFCSPNVGRTVDKNFMIRPGTAKNIRSQIISYGNYMIKYLHVFDNNNSVPKMENGGTVLLDYMLAPDDDKWGLVIALPNDTMFLGQIEGKLLYNGDTVDLSPIVDQYDPIGTIGNSGTQSIDSNTGAVNPYQTHLHVEVIADSTHGGDLTSFNVLRYVDYEQPDYSLSVKSELSSNGIVLKYPGHLASKIAVKAEISGEGLNDNRYDAIMDVNSMKLYLREKNNGAVFQLIEGANEEAEISLGGRIGETRINHNPFRFFNYNTVNNWGQTGILSNAYNGSRVALINRPHPWDEYFFTDFISRIHVNDTRTDGNLMVANAPEDARYVDGKHDLKTEITDIKQSLIDSTFEVVLDNFKPYIKSINASIHGVLVYDFHWETVNGKLEPRGGVVANTPSFTAFDLAQGMIVEVEASEQLDTLILNLDRNIDSCGEENDPDLTAVGIAQTNRRSWIFTFGNLTSCPLGGGTIDPTGGDWRFEFTGRDYGPNGTPGSQLLDFSGAYDVIVDRAQNTIPQLALDHRISITAGSEWSGTQDASLTSGVDDTHYFGFTCSANLWDPHSGNSEVAKKSVNGELLFQCCKDIKVEIAAPNFIQPSGCDSADGSFSHRGFSATPSIPFSEGRYLFHVESDGVIVEPDEFGNFQNLPSGEYCVVATDPTGCTGTECFVLRYESEPEEIVETIIPACDEDSPSGGIDLIVYYPIDASHAYNFQWSNGVIHEDDTYSTVTGLVSGVYQVTITSTVDPECEIIREYTVPIADLSSPDLSLNVDLTHPCLDDNNGVIRVRTNGDEGPYEILWNDGQDYDFEREDLTAGTYSFSVSGRCHTVTETVSLRSLTAEAISQSGCGSGELNAIAANGNSPYSFSWSSGIEANNTNSSSLSGMPTGNYQVTVTDRFGCKEEINNLILDNQEVFILDATASCEGIETGAIEIGINNPEDVFTQVYLNGGAVGGTGQSSGDFSLLLDNLSGGQSYEISVDFGDGCIISLIQDLENEDLELRLTSTENDVCTFNEFCNGNLVAQNSTFSPITFSIEDASGGGFLSRCQIDGRCEGADGVVVTRRARNRRITLAEYRNIVDVSVGVLITEQERTELLRGLPEDENECERIWFCPLSLETTPILNSFTNTRPLTGFVDQETGCTVLVCPNRVVDLCQERDNVFIVNGIDPFTFEFETNNVPEDCNLKTISVLKLLTWNDEMEIDPIIGADYSGSELHDFILEIIGDEDAEKKAICATVTYCRNDFRFISSNINLIDCSTGYQETIGDPVGVICTNLNVTCRFVRSCVTRQLGDYLQYQCATPDGYYTREFPSEFEVMELDQLISGGEDEDYILFDAQLEDLFFEDVAYMEQDGQLYPKPIVKSVNGDQIFLDFSVGSFANMKYHRMQDVQSTFIQQDLFDQFHLIKNNTTSYTFMYEPNEGEPTKYEISSTDILSTSLTPLNNGTVYVSGNTTGKLSMDGSFISDSQNDLTYFWLEFDGNGVMINSEFASVNGAVNANENIKGKSGAQLLRVRENSTGLLQFSNVNNSEVLSKQSLCLIDPESKNQTSFFSPELVGKNVVAVSSIDQSAQLISFESGSNGEELYSIVNLSENNVLVQDIQTLEGRISDTHITTVNQNEVVVGLTFTGTIIYDGNSFKSSGESDILFLTVDSGNNLIGYAQYGTEGLEELKYLEFIDGQIIIGGNYSGPEKVRKIGNLKFRQPLILFEEGDGALEMVRPFLSYLSEKEFEAPKLFSLTDQKMEMENNDLNSSIKVYPNPSTGVFIVTIPDTQYASSKFTKISIADNLGRSLSVEPSVRQIKSAKSYTFNMSEFKSGLYFVRILDENGDQSIPVILSSKRKK